jgi:hypothetical protein
MIEHFAQTFCDLVKSLWSTPDHDLSSSRSISITEFTELLAYEEREDEFPQEYQNKQKVNRSMHNLIPTNPFTATVRINKVGSPAERDLVEDLALYVEKESPTSFPTTPFSRARIMNRSSDRTSYTMFAARDRLRLEAQSSSKDEYSRNAALQARTSGQCAVFDPNQKSDGLALTCGNHCALKVGKGQCCSCRSMLPVRANTFVYLEFSVTVTGSQVPTLCVGLAPPDCPLNVMVGSWPRSVGLFSDGQLLVDSRWFPDISLSSFLRPPKVSAGTTMGVLVYLRDPSAAQGDHRAADSEQFDLSCYYPDSPVASSAWSLFNFAFGVGEEALRVTSKMVKKYLRMDIGDLNLTANHTTGSSTAKSVEGEILVSDALCKESAEDMFNEEVEVDVVDGGGADKGQLHIRWNINGHQSKYSSNALDTVSDIDSMQAPLYPTVSLLSDDTRVWCRFCEADIVFRERSVIGAPKGVRVYCLDGSLLLDEKD